MRIDFLVSSKDMKSQVNEKKYEKFSHQKQFRPKMYFSVKKMHTQNKTKEALINLPSKTKVNYIFETIKMKERKSKRILLNFPPW